MVRLMSALVQLENYAHLNYEGFGKALKKHDKLTKRACRLSFMRHWVNAQSFAYSPVLRRMLSATEEAYQLLVSRQPDEAQHVADVDEVRKLEALRDIKGAIGRGEDAEEGALPRAAAAAVAAAAVAGVAVPA